MNTKTPPKPSPTLPPRPQPRPRVEPCQATQPSPSPAPDPRIPAIRLAYRQRLGAMRPQRNGWRLLAVASLLSLGAVLAWPSLNPAPCVPVGQGRQP